jgi:hypothetical protein
MQAEAVMFMHTMEKEAITCLGKVGSSRASVCMFYSYLREKIQDELILPLHSLRAKIYRTSLIFVPSGPIQRTVYKKLISNRIDFFLKTVFLIAQQFMK